MTKPIFKVGDIVRFNDEFKNIHRGLLIVVKNTINKSQGFGQYQKTVHGCDMLPIGSDYSDLIGYYEFTLELAQ